MDNVMSVLLQGVQDSWSAGVESGDQEDSVSHGWNAGQLSLVGEVIDTKPEVDKQFLMDAYAIYDSDPRVNGPDDYEAFRDAVSSVLIDRVRHLVPESANG